MRSLLFVCTANVCRSPMTETLMQARLQALPDGDGWRVESAGTWAQDGRPAASNAVAVMEERGIGGHLRAHRSRAVTGQLLGEFDLILTMERGQREALQVEFPEVAGRVYLLSELSGPGYDVLAPDGAGMAQYSALADELGQLLEDGFDRIVALTREEHS